MQNTFRFNSEIEIRVAVGQQFLPQKATHALRTSSWRAHREVSRFDECVRCGHRYPIQQPHYQLLAPPLQVPPGRCRCYVVVMQSMCTHETPEMWPPPCKRAKTWLRASKAWPASVESTAGKPSATKLCLDPTECESAELRMCRVSHGPINWIVPLSN